MNHLVRPFLLSLFMTSMFVAGCGEDDPALPPPPPPLGSDDGGMSPPENASTLELWSTPELRMRSGEQEVIGVRLLDEDGEPVVGEQVQFVLDGRAQDSSLTDTEGTTDEEGLTQTILIAGETPGTFRVRARAESAAPVSVTVAVSDAGFGALEVEAVYEGEREIGRVVVGAFAGRTCDEVGPDEMAERRAVLTEEETMAEIFGLPAETTYAVVARGEREDGVLLAQGCEEDVLVVVDETQSVSITLSDRALDLSGVYSTSIELETPELANMLPEAEASVDQDAMLLLDAIEGRLMALGDEEALAILQSQRAAGGLDAGLAITLADEEATLASALELVFEQTSARLANLNVLGELRVGEEFGWVTSSVEFGETDELEASPLLTDLALAEIEPTGVVMASVTDADTLDLEHLGLPLPMGSLLTTATEVVLAEAIESDSTAITEAASCGIVFEWWIRSQPIDVCDLTCIEAACLEAVRVSLEERMSTIERLNVSRARLHVSGTLNPVDDEEDGMTEGLSGTDLTVLWTPETGVDPEELRATLSADRGYVP